MVDEEYVQFPKMYKGVTEVGVGCHFATEHIRDSEFEINISHHAIKKEFIDITGPMHPGSSKSLFCLKHIVDAT